MAIITEWINKGNKDKSPSFLMSDNGVYTIAALYYHYLADEVSAEDKRDQFISFVLDSVERWYDEMYAEDEILYGNSGYLYCLLILHDTFVLFWEMNSTVIHGIFAKLIFVKKWEFRLS